MCLQLTIFEIQVVANSRQPLFFHCLAGQLFRFNFFVSLFPSYLEKEFTVFDLQSGKTVR